MISGFLDCLKDCSVYVVFVCTSCVVDVTRVEWAGLEPQRYSGRDLLRLRSTNACRHLVDISVVRRVELLGIRRTGQHRGGRRRRCGCRVPRLLGHSSTAFASSVYQQTFHSIPVIVSDRNKSADYLPLSCLLHVCEPGRPRVLKQLSHSVNESGIKQRLPPVTGSFPSIFMLNCNSLAKNNAKETLIADVSASSADVIAVTETHYKARHDDSVSNIDGFTCFRKDRFKRKGGGVCLYTKYNSNASRVEFNQSLDNAEFVWVSFSVSGANVYLCCCYHPPKPLYSCHDLLSLLCEQIDQILHRDCDAVIILTVLCVKLIVDYVKLLTKTHGS